MLGHETEVSQRRERAGFPSWRAIITGSGFTALTALTAQGGESWAVSVFPAFPISLSGLISDEASLRQLFLYENCCFLLVTLFTGVES
jgi:hypothetical protein